MLHSESFDVSDINERDYSKVSRLEKTALVVYLIGGETGSDLLHSLEPKKQKELKSLIAMFPPIKRKLAIQVMKEFEFDVSEVVISESAQEFSRKLAETKSIANFLLEGGFAAENVKGLEDLKGEEPSMIFNLVQNLHPQMISTILAYIGDEKAGKLLELFPEQERNMLVHSVAQMTTIKPLALKNLAQIIDKTHTSDEGISGYMPIGGPKSAASMLNQLAGGMDESALEYINTENPTLSDDVRDNMFIFIDLLKLEDRSMQTVVAALEPSLMLDALKGQPQEIVDKFVSGMSNRQKARFLEDLDDKPAMKISEVISAQKEILSQVRRMGDKGEIIIPGKGDDYV